jgi:dihydrofolate synthase/folylpolyglutamate synthase
VGLGAKCDTTNVVTPEISVITSIGLDHTELLGPTVQHIAKEKAGIIKKDRPIVLGPAA